jgi:hypothetical protein
MRRSCHHALLHGRGGRHRRHPHHDGALFAGQAAGANRFEVTSLRGVRPILVKTIADLEKKDAAAAKADMENYDSAWNGVEVYVNTRSMDLYNEIEHHYQTAVTDALNKPNPDTAPILADAKAMLVKYDEMLALVEKSAPLNRLYDDVARLRIERAHLREVTPALKAGNVAKARKSFEAFDDNWDNIEDLVKERSRESYDAIRKGDGHYRTRVDARQARCGRDACHRQRCDDRVQQDRQPDNARSS